MGIHKIFNQKLMFKPTLIDSPKTHMSFYDFVRCLSLALSFLHLILQNHWTNLNQT